MLRLKKSELSKIGLGTAALGRRSYINIRSKNEPVFTDIDTFRKKGLDLLHYAWDIGLRHFDSSSGYGIAEKLLLIFLNELNERNISISTKWGYTYVANFKSNPKQHEVKEHSLKKLNEQWQKSKLFLPHLNLYQIHSVTPDSDVLENPEVLNRLYEIKNDHEIDIGITTSGEKQIEIVEKALGIKINNKNLFNSFQVTYNILDQGLIRIKDKLLDKKIIVKEALANGRILKNKNYPHYNNLYDQLDQLAKKYNVTTDAVALRFCIESFSNAMVLSGASTKEQLSQNVKAADFSISKSELEELQTFAIDTETYWNERKTLAWN